MTTDGETAVAMASVMAVLIEPAPYIIRLLDELDQQWPGQISVWFTAINVSQPWQAKSGGCRYRVLPAGRRATLASLFCEIRTRRPKIVFVAGWSHPVILAAILLARLAGAKVVALSDTWVSNSTGLRSLAKAAILSLVHRFCPGGKRQSRYLRNLGVPDERIFPGNMTVDTVAIDRFLRFEGYQRRLQVRRALSLKDDDTVFLFVGRLEPVKGPDVILKAFSSGRRDPKCRLVMVGDGSMRSDVIAAVARDPRISYRGRLEGTDLWAQFAAADVFVGPSRSEPWGLVVNEALAFGLPVVVSDCFGCIDDLVVHEGNGLIVPAGDISALRDAMERLSSDRRQLGELRDSVRVLMRGWTTAAWAKNVVAAWRDAIREDII